MGQKSAFFVVMGENLVCKTMSGAFHKNHHRFHGAIILYNKMLKIITARERKPAPSSSLSGQHLLLREQHYILNIFMLVSFTS